MKIVCLHDQHWSALRRAKIGIGETHEGDIAALNTAALLSPPTAADALEPLAKDHGQATQNKDLRSNQRCRIRRVRSYYGPFLSDYQFGRYSLPIRRHSRKGGLSAAFVDGHASYLPPVAWSYMGDPPNGASGGAVWTGAGAAVNREIPSRYATHPRITPYDELERGNSVPPRGGRSSAR